MSDQSYEFEHDAPIHLVEDDLLERDELARNLAAAILSWDGDTSIVIGLCGAWGSGKTSLANLVRDKLKKSQIPPKIIDIEPWRWSVGQKYLDIFFSELGRAIGRHGGRLAVWRRRFEIYGKSLQMPGRILPSSLLKNLLFIFGSGSIVWGLASSSWEFKIGGAALILTTFFGWAGNALTEISEWFGLLIGASEKSIDEQKREIEAYLRRSEDFKCVVVLDDIDRLPPRDILEIFKLVRVNANFPRIVFLMLFDRRVVEANLKTEFPESNYGRKYLEKIVTMLIDIPKIERSTLDRLLNAKLDPILHPNADARGLSDRSRWKTVYEVLVHYYVRNIRDVKRIINSVKFQASLLLKGERVEVNPIDLFVLELLRLYEPDVHQWIHESKSVLVDLPDLLTGETSKEARLKSIERLLQQCHGREDILRNTLGFLFPQILGLPMEGSWEKDRRVCSKEHFDAYFLMRPTAFGIAEAEIQMLIEEAGDSNVFLEHLEVLRTRGLLSKALSRLELSLGSFPPNHRKNVLRSMFQIGEKSSPDFDALHWQDSADLAADISYDLLTRIPDSQRRGTVEHLINSAGALTVPLKILVRVSHSASIEGRSEGDKVIFSDDEIVALRNIWMKAVSELAESRELLDRDFAIEILSYWKSLTSAEYVEKWIMNSIKSVDEAVKLLRSCLGYMTVNGIPHWVLHGKCIDDLRIHDLLIEKLDGIDHEQYEGRERIALTLFRQLLSDEKSKSRNEASVRYYE